MLSKQFKKQSSNDNTPKVFLALEGGGAHGAFTWGALEVLEEEGILEHIVAVSGTSAGANNAAAMVAGLESKKKGGAKSVLSTLWEGIGRKGDAMKPIKDMYRMFSMTSWPNMPDNFKSHAEIANHYSSLKTQAGYVRDHIADVIKDWKPLQNSAIKIFLGASRLERTRSGPNILHEHNFTNKDIDADAVGASGCLFGTHTKDGVEYKDGAYVKNPPMVGVMKDEEYSDLFAIMLSPEPSKITPKHQNHLVAEDSDGLLGSETYSHLAHEVQRGRKVHVISMVLPNWANESSKMNFDTKWIKALHDAGRTAALEWVKNHKHDLGKRASYAPNITADQNSMDLQDTPEVA